jgi:hypothetical protein
MWFGTAGDLVTQRSLNPVFETRLQGTANADHRILAGFHNILNGAAYGADTNQSSEEVYFRKAAANTYWETVTRSTANATELVTPLNTTQCALGPCTTAAMRILRIELENTGVNGVARFYIDGALVATHNTNTVPAAVTRLGWSIGNGVSAAIAAPGRTVDIDYIRVWSDDPETQVQGATYTQSDTITESDAIRVITDGTEHMVFKNQMDDEGLGQIGVDIKYFLLKTKEIIMTGILKAKEVVADVFRAKKVITEELCVGTDEDSVCMNKAQLQNILNGTQPAAGTNTSSSGSADNNSSQTDSPITIHGANPATISVGTTYSDMGVTAHDAQGNVTSYTITVDGAPVPPGGSVSIDTSVAGDHTIVYTVTNSSVSATRILHVTTPDTTPPVVTVTPGNDTIHVGEAWSDAGATATDAVAGNLSATPSGSVDTTTVGTYTITYTATDPAGNAGSATRIVTVNL